MTIAVKLVRLKSRAKMRGRPKYRYVLRWQGVEGWEQESCRTADGKTAKAIRDRKFDEVNGLLETKDDSPQKSAGGWETLQERERLALESRNKASGTIYDQCRALRLFCDVSEVVCPADVTYFDVERFIADRQKNGLAAATVNHDLWALRAAFNRAVKRGDIESNPFRDVEKLNEVTAERDAVQADAFRQILVHFADRPIVQTFLLVSLQVGCRIRELAYLLWSDVEPESDWLMIRNKELPDGTIWRPKRISSIRDVWLPPWLMQRLTALKLARKPYVWSQHLADIGRAFDDEFRPEAFVGFFQHALAYACDDLGIDRFSHHDLRSTQQTWLAEHGWEDGICMAVAGHGSGRATVLRKHYWRVNHRRMTKPAFEDVAGIFLDWKVVSGDPEVKIQRMGDIAERA